MKRVLLAIAVLLLLATSARAQNYAACQVNGIITVCPDNVRLKTGKTLIETYIPSLDASKIGSGTFAVARIPTAIPAINIGGGGVDNTEFGYLDGVTSSVQTQLNALLPASSNKLPPTPTAANKLLYDTGTDYAETAACGTAGYILEGGSPPACTQSPTVGTKITVPRIDSSGALILNGATGNNVQLSVNSTTVLTAAATGLTATQPLAMSSKNITGLAPATANGDALSYPWITSGATFNTLASGFNITASNGTYAGTGLTYTFPEAGTYWCEATVRSSVGVSVGAGANISLKLRNTTTSTDITNSIRIGAYASTIGVAYITTTPFAEVVTVSGADTLEVYAASNTGTTYTTRSVDSDSAGYSKLGCMKIAP